MGTTFDRNMRPKGVATTRHLWVVCAVLFCAQGANSLNLTTDEGSGLDPWQLTAIPDDESTDQSDPPDDRGSDDPLSSLNLTIIGVVLIVGVAIVIVAGCVVCGLRWWCRRGNVNFNSPNSMTIIQNPALDPCLASGTCTTATDSTMPCPIPQGYHTIHATRPSSSPTTSSLPTMFHDLNRWAPSGMKAYSHGELDKVLQNQSAIEDPVLQVTPL